MSWCRGKSSRPRTRTARSTPPLLRAQRRPPLEELNRRMRVVATGSYRYTYTRRDCLINTFRCVSHGPARNYTRDVDVPNISLLREFDGLKRPGQPKLGATRAMMTHIIESCRLSVPRAQTASATVLSRLFVRALCACYPLVGPCQETLKGGGMGRLGPEHGTLIPRASSPVIYIYIYWPGGV